MHVLVTRPEADAGPLRAQLEALGHRVTVDPMLRVETLPIAPDALAGAAALIFTSRNGVRALATGPAMSEARQLPVFAVGPGTAQLALEQGFAEVTTGKGTGAELVPILVEAAMSLKGALVHIRGKDVAYDLRQALATHAIAIREIPAYRTIPAQAFRPNTLELLQSGEINAVVLMSPRTGATFASLIANAGLENPAKKLVLLCLSVAVAKTVEPLGAARIEVANAPNTVDILAAVTRVATLWSGV
ncbi:MAG: uroporphyrinogen-III synthase [Hyphomicrobium sp.]|jgi:uroporphyrinogen-III synthase